MRMRWIVVFAVIGIAMWPCGALAAEIAGNWVAEVTGPMLLEPVVFQRMVSAPAQFSPMLDHCSPHHFETERNLTQQCRSPGASHSQIWQLQSCQPCYSAAERPVPPPDSARGLRAQQELKPDLGSQNLYQRSP